MKKWLAMILALTLVLTSCVPLAALAEALTADAIQALNDGKAAIYTHDDRVTFVDGACAASPIADMDDAEAVVTDMIPLTGGDERTQFEPWRTLTDASGNRYYVFQQMYADTTVSGGAMKVVTDAEGNMLGLVASVVNDLPEIEEGAGITPKQAEALVMQKLADDNVEADLVEDRTERIILPTMLDLDAEDVDLESRFVWVVFTTNPDASLKKGSDLPYLAHYVDMNGEYLYSLPTVFPGDAASTSGFNTAYVFEFMEPVAYTGTVKLSTGEEREITVDVMRDTRTGMYYLGNLERRIVVADCFEFLYNGGHVVMEASKDNTDWDNTCLLSLYNYCRAWDYYKEIGWLGGDGQGTPMIVLKDFCDSDHTPVNNAAYAGYFLGWEVFMSSDINDYAQCLDVLGHEFTHCVTGSTMTYNAYMNDYGAINEAISDIQGNICEMMLGATDDLTWKIAEQGLSPLRCMSDPHKFRQPEYAWDLYYQPNAKVPTTLNDHGGVHTNSSLLNGIAWLLWKKGGMSLEEARAYWFAVDCSMVPGTDYAQLAELLPWVLKNEGMEQYMDALEAAMDATRIRTDAVPDHFDDDRALVTLTTPDVEAFANADWSMYILSVDAEGVKQRVTDIVKGNPGYEDALTDLGIDLGFIPDPKEAEAEKEEKKGLSLMQKVGQVLSIIGDALQKGDEEPEPEPEPEKSGYRQVLAGLIKWGRVYFGDLVYMGSSSAGQDGHTIRMVTRPGMTVPVLIKVGLLPNGDPGDIGLAVYAFGSWIDVTSTLQSVAEKVAQSGQSGFDPTALLGLLGQDDSGDASELFEKALSLIRDPQPLLDGLFFEIKPGEVCEIPNTGLEAVKAMDMDGASNIWEALADEAQAPGTDYGTSELYTPEELDAAAAQVLDAFATFEGCELHDLRYAGDDCDSEENLKWMNELGESEGKHYVQVCEFLSDFHSPVEGGGAWEADEEYTDWEWWLAREEGGDWELLTWGY